MSDQDNISPFNQEGSRRLSEDKLMAYLEGKLSPTEQHEVEQWLADEGMESDAMEGLRSMDLNETKHTVARLNRKLHQSIANKKRPRRQSLSNQFSWLAILIVLLLVIIAYIIVRKAI